MAKQLAVLYANIIEEQVATGKYPFTTQGLIYAGMLSPITDSSGAVKYRLQRAKRLKAVNTPADTANKGSDALAIFNALGEVQWDTIELENQVERTIGASYDLLKDLQPDSTGSLFQATIASKLETALTETEENLVGKMVALGISGTNLTANATQLPALDSATNILRAYELFKNDLVRITLIVDEFKAYTDESEVVSHLHPLFKNAISQLAGMAYLPHAEVLENGMPVQGTLHGVAFTTDKLLNTVSVKVGTTDNIPAYVISYTKSLAVQSPTEAMFSFDHVLVGKRFIGTRYWDANKIVDPVRNRIGFAPAAGFGTIPVSAKISA